MAPSPADASPRSLVVFKFGGTSVGTAGRLRRIVGIVQEAAAKHRVVVVASALSKVTRLLSSGLEAFATHEGEEQDAALDSLVRQMRERHMSQARDVLSEEGTQSYTAILDHRLERMREAFDVVGRDGFSPALRDVILATGEQCAVPMVAAAIHESGLHALLGHATELVVTDDTFGEANVRLSDTEEAVQRWYRTLPDDAVAVVAGFIGATREGHTTTLGFEGSDYSAALFAALLNASSLTRYTDIDALYTDDPRTNSEAERIERISMERAFALTESGRLGMHPKTLRPLVEKEIPMHIRSIIDPDAPGTQIIPEAQMIASPEPGRGEHPSA